MYNFVTACINADALLEEIDDYVLKWHESDTELPVYDYLGMTEEEYMLWLEDAFYLKYIILAHEEGSDISAVLRRYSELGMAARADDPSEAKKIYSWLEAHGKV